MILGANGTISSSYKPEIDYTDLYAYYDPGDITSYDPGTDPNTIYDISGNSAIDLTNSYPTPGSVSNNQGYLVLQAGGIGDHWVNQSSYNFGLGDPYTIIQIARYSNTDTTTISFNGSSPIMRFGLNIGNAGFLQSGSVSTAGTPAGLEWKFMALSCASGLGKLFVNRNTPVNVSGLDDMSNNFSYNRNSTTTSKLEVGPLLFYTRQLTPGEVYYIYDFYYSKFLFG